jgi:hypothetical protein
MNWQPLKDAYDDNGLVLALGAGVSFDSKLPTWIQLLQRIGRKCLDVNGDRLLDVNGDRLVDDLRAEGFSLPAIATMLKTRCPTNIEFSEIVRAALYQDFEPYQQRNIKSADMKRLIENACSKNHTLRATAALCAKWNEEAASFSRNDKIHAIVNFNLDAILREYAAVRYKKVFLRSVERPSKSSDPKKTNIYYMHGFLRFDSEEGNQEKEAFDKLVLSEQAYFDFFNSPTGFFNYTFLYLLREYACLFIGLSLQDENIRRLLHYSKKEREQAYEEEKKQKDKMKEREQAYEEEKKQKDKIQEKVLRHFAIIKRYKSSELKNLVEKSLAELGTNIIWIDDYAEIPKGLGQIYGDKWEKVYNDLLSFGAQRN